MHWLISTSCIALLLSYAAYRNALTPWAMLTAGIVAGLHAYHPWGIFFGLLGMFFLSGTFVTKIKHAQKSKFTLSATGGTSDTAAPQPRVLWQVLANSAPATLFILLHRLHLSDRLRVAPAFLVYGSTDVCLPYPILTPSGSHPTTWIALMNLAPYAVVAAYAAASADTFSSELGILSSEQPILITALFRGQIKRVPKGTNGGVTVVGLLAGFVGAGIIGLVSAFGLPLCDGGSDVIEKRSAFVNVYGLDRLDIKLKRWTLQEQLVFAAIVALWGTLGSILDSVLGAWLQASVVEVRSGKVIEGEGGRKVLVVAGSSKKDDDASKARRVLVGRDILSNNGVNFVTGLVMSAGAILAMIVWLGGLKALTTGEGVSGVTPPMATGKSV